MMKRLILTSAFGLLLAILGCQKIEPSPNAGYIAVTSTPSGASILLDDSLLSIKTNCIITDVDTGTHKITMKYDDWPDWRTIVNVNEGDTSFVNAALRPEPVDTDSIYIKWEIDLPGDWNSYSYPALGTDGTLYLGTSDGLIAISSTGSLKWSYSTGGEVRSSPAIGSEGTIYFGCNDYHLYAVKPDGSLKWKKQTQGEIYSSPSIALDGTIYFGSADSNLYAVSPEGYINWKRKLDLPVNSKAIIGHNGDIYLPIGHCLYAVTPDNTIKWIYETSGGGIGVPAIGADGTIYFSCGDGYLYALSSEGSLKWRCGTVGRISTPVLGSDGTIYVTANYVEYDGQWWQGHIYAIATNGIVKWNNKLTENYSEACSDAILGADGNIYVSFFIGDYSLPYLFALTDNCTIKWNIQTEGLPIAIASDGTFYLASSYSDFLYAIQTSSFGLASSPWPRYGHDNQNTGRAGGP